MSGKDFRPYAMCRVGGKGIRVGRDRVHRAAIKDGSEGLGVCEVVVDAGEVAVMVVVGTAVEDVIVGA